MRYNRNPDIENLRQVASEARAIPEWSDYATFCEKYDRGLRSEAFTLLEGFIGFMERAPFVERRRFVIWLLERLERMNGGKIQSPHKALPHPLASRIVQPTLEEWTQVEPACDEPHVWLGRYENLKRAIELNPNNDQARRKLITLIRGSVSMAAHELPFGYGYYGDPQEGIASLDEAEGLFVGWSAQRKGACQVCRRN